jgi:signal transduction histidine kinase
MGIGDRIRRLDQRWIDLGLAAVVSAWFLVELTTRDPRGFDRLGSALTFALMAVPFAVRSRHLLPACVAYAAAVLLQQPLDAGLMNYFDAPFAILFSLLYTVGRRTDRWTTVALALVLYGGTAGALSMAEEESLAADLVWGIGLCAPPVLAGRALRTHRRVRDELEAAQRELSAGQETRAARAVEDERARIAAELQTVLANDVSAIVVQAEAVHRVLAVGEREFAGEALRVIEDTGREALSEMRRLLGVLRHDHDHEGPSLAPQPGVAEIAGLARPRVGDAPAVAVRFDGDPVDVSPGIDLAAYWIAERAVEAAGAAGAEAVEVVARYERGRIALRIADDRPPSHASDADTALVAAMRARADLYGGQVRVSRAEDARVLDAVLPLRGAEMAA